VQVPPQTRISSRDAVTGALQRYTAALEHRDISALKSVWPSLAGTQQTAIETEFANARSISVTFVNLKIDLTGATATITGLRQYALRTRDGQQLRSETITTIGMRQTGNDWVIESVRHQAAR
jgi:ketosteroid isomerase-like protein